MPQQFANFINGEWVESPEVSPNINPSNLDDVIGEFARADAEQTQRAIRAAADAFATWSLSTPQQRFDVLDRTGSALLERKEELGRLLAREEGKTVAEGIGEVGRAGQIFKFFAGEALRIGGEIVPSVRPGLTVEVTREPLGVIGLITPWNFPIAIPAWKIAPALAYGNCVVLKPADLVPASAWELVKIIAQAGAPHGVINLVMGRGTVVGEALVASPLVNAISFTGSVATGRAIAARCVASGKKVQLEMGGKNPMVVLDDADLDVAVEACINGAFFSTGQRCTASSRLIVTEGIHDRFVEAMKARMVTLKIGDALAAESKRQLSTLLTRSLWDSQTSRMCRSKPKPTRHCVPSPGSMVAVRLLMRTMVPTTVCRYLSSKATFSPQRKSLRVGRGAAGGSGATA